MTKEPLLDSDKFGVVNPFGFEGALYRDGEKGAADTPAAKAEAAALSTQLQKEIDWKKR